MNELARSPRSGVVDVRVTQHSVSVAGVDFSAAYGFAWSSLPLSIRQLVPDANEPAAAAELDDRDRTVRRHRASGIHWQPVTIWRASSLGIALIKARRPLRNLGNKRFGPAGEFYDGEIDYRSATSAPIRRVATIGEPTAARKSAAKHLDHADVVETIDYLPRVVADDLRAHVRTPSYEHGLLLQYRSRMDLPYRQELRLLRLSNTSAAVVVAEREAQVLPSGCTAEQAQSVVSDLPWTVSRFAYQLGPRPLGTQSIDQSDRPQLP